jgi:hypothetical protein
MLPDGNFEGGAVEDLEDEGLIGIGVQASLARLYKSDQSRFVDELAGTLERALPDETKVERRGGLFQEKRVSALRIHLGEHLYSLELPPRGALISTRTKMVRGIKLKTEPLGIDEWLAAVSQALAQFAQSNQQARDALWNLIETRTNSEEDAL